MHCSVKYMPMGTTGGWKKIGDKPVIGPEYGTTFDVSVMKEDGVYEQRIQAPSPEYAAIIGTKPFDVLYQRTAWLKDTGGI